MFCAFANNRTGWQPAWFANTHADTESHNYTITYADVHPVGDLGNGNTAIGNGSLLSLTTGTYNVAMGYQALSANTTGSGNIALGASAGINLTTGDNNIDIGNEGTAGSLARSGLVTQRFTPRHL